MNKLFTTLTTMGIAMVLTACASAVGPNRTVLPLDHGPRAQTTPWENQQRLLHAKQQAKVDVKNPSQAPNK